MSDTLMHPHRTRELVNRLECVGIPLGERRVDSLIQSAREDVQNEAGHAISLDSDRAWNAVEGRVLDALDIDPDIAYPAARAA